MKTLYRGVKFQTPNNQSGYWSAFTSTSLNKDIAQNFAGPSGTVFEIRLD